MAYQDRVLKQTVLWVPESRRVALEGPSRTAANTRIWTLYHYESPDRPPELPYVPVHHSNAFLEDYVHDWNHEKGVLRYGSRASEGRVWILVEDLKPEPRPRRR
jgi:hypothetical protein